MTVGPIAQPDTQEGEKQGEKQGEKRTGHTSTHPVSHNRETGHPEGAKPSKLSFWDLATYDSLPAPPGTLTDEPPTPGAVP